MDSRLKKFYIIAGIVLIVFVAGTVACCVMADMTLGQGAGTMGFLILLGGGFLYWRKNHE